MALRARVKGPTGPGSDGSRALPRHRFQMTGTSRIFTTIENAKSVA